MTAALFHDQIIGILPKLRVQALALTRNRAAAEDLVQEALVMVVVHGMSYEALAESTGCAVGTAKSRVFRARRQLESWMLGEKPERAPRRVAREMADEGVVFAA